MDTQSWLYTKRNDFGEFDLHVEYWTKSNGNSGISIRDSSRAKWGIITPPDYTKTPSKIGYEIQINNRYPTRILPAASMASWTPQGRPARRRLERHGHPLAQRQDTVKINGRVVAEHAGDPKRAKVGPIGLQLHDQFSITMFRNIRIQEIGK